MRVNNTFSVIPNRISSFMPLSALFKISRKRLFCPFYHLVSNEDVPHIKHLYSFKNVHQFRKDLDVLLKNFIPIDLPDLSKIVREGSMKKNGFFLSFDDGLSECYHVIAPILKEKGVPATFFINSAFVDNKNLFYRYQASIIIEFLKNNPISDQVKKEIDMLLPQKPGEKPDVIKSILGIHYNNKHILVELAKRLNIQFDEYLSHRNPYLSSSQVRGMMRDGFSFGAHSIDHPRYSDISFEEQVKQTKDSIAFLLNSFEVPCKTFAFPFTDHGVKKQFFDMVLHPDRGLVDLSFGCAGLKEDYLSSHIQRTAMEGKNVPAETIIFKEYLYYMMKGLVNKNKIVRV